MRQIFPILITLTVLSAIILVSANNTVKIEANILSNDSYLEIEVSTNISFGNVQKGQKSSEKTIYINNTGTEDISVIPLLPDSYSGAFEYLFFREQQSDINGIKNISNKIGDFTMNVSKPASGSTVRKEQFYTRLDLTNYQDQIFGNLIGHTTNLTIIAVPQ